MARYWAYAGLPFAGDAFEWDDTVPDDWQAVAGWHTEVLSLGSIRPPQDGRGSAHALAGLGAPFTDYERHHRPFFEALAEVAETQAHQK